MYLSTAYVLALSVCLIPASCSALSSATDSQGNTFDGTIQMSTTTPSPISSTEMCSPSMTTSLSLPRTRHTVIVGAAGKLAFEPNQTYAEIGDVVEFNFLALNHTLTQSSLSDPCTNIGGFSTGFNQFNPRNASGQYVVQYAVNTLDPQWFFCAQTKGISHCHAGMIFALNPDGPLKSFMQSPAFPGLSTTPESVSATSLPVLAPMATSGASSPTPATTSLSHSNWTSPSLGSPTSSAVSTSGGIRLGVSRSLLVLLVIFFAKF